VIDQWTPDGDPKRTTLGGLAAVSVEAPLSQRLALAVRYEAAITRSVFDSNDLPADFERKQGVRQRVGFGARIRI
jgi:hypothetical protein